MPESLDLGESGRRRLADRLANGRRLSEWLGRELAGQLGYCFAFLPEDVPHEWAERFSSSGALHSSRWTGSGSGSPPALDTDLAMGRFVSSYLAEKRGGICLVEEWWREPGNPHLARMRGRVWNWNGQVLAGVGDRMDPHEIARFLTDWSILPTYNGLLADLEPTAKERLFAAETLTDSDVADLIRCVEYVFDGAAYDGESYVVAEIDRPL